LKASTPEVAKILTTFGSADFQTDQNLLVELFKENPIRDDVPELKFQNYPAEQQRFALGTTSTEALLKKILDAWVSGNGHKAAIDKLVWVLRQGTYNKEASKNMFHAMPIPY